MLETATAAVLLVLLQVLEVLRADLPMAMALQPIVRQCLVNSRSFGRFGKLASDA